MQCPLYLLFGNTNCQVTLLCHETLGTLPLPTTLPRCPLYLGQSMGSDHCVLKEEKVGLPGPVCLGDNQGCPEGPMNVLVQTYSSFEGFPCQSPCALSQEPGRQCHQVCPAGCLCEDEESQRAVSAWGFAALLHMGGAPRAEAPVSAL